jgi:hypothetical protein
MSTPAADVDVDSTEQAAADQAGPTRRRIAQPNIGRGERARRVDLELGGYEYTARCPKLIVWSDMAGIIAEQGGSRRERRRAGDTEPAESSRITTDRIRLTQAVTHFLQGCLSADDWAAIAQDLNNPDDDLDVPDLWAAGLRLVAEFLPDMKGMAKSIGMKIPGELDKLADRIDPQTGLLTEDEPAPAKAAPAPRKRAAGKRR